MASKHFSPDQWKTLERIGDILIPGDETLPVFSVCGFYNHVDRLVGFLQESDVKDMRQLLNVMKYLPNFVIRFILWIATKEHFFPGPIGLNFRKLNVGLRGITFSLYYSFLNNTNGCGQRVKEVIDYDAAIRTKLEKADDMPNLVESANPLNTKHAS